MLESFHMITFVTAMDLIQLKRKLSQSQLDLNACLFYCQFPTQGVICWLPIRATGSRMFCKICVSCKNDLFFCADQLTKIIMEATIDRDHAEANSTSRPWIRLSTPEVRCITVAQAALPADKNNSGLSPLLRVHQP